MIDKNLADGFRLPAFLSSVPTCVLLTYQPSTINTGLTQPATGFVQDGVESPASSGIFMVFPQDDTVDLKYQFYLKATADGTSNYYSTLFTLIVGCTSDFTQTADPSFVTSLVLWVNDPNLDIYSILPPTLSANTPSYCG